MEKITQNTIVNKFYGKIFMSFMNIFLKSRGNYGKN